MIALVSEDRADLLRWALSGALALFAHGAIAAAMMQWTVPVEEDAAAAPIIIDLAPLPIAPMEFPNDLAPPPERVKTEIPEVQPEQKVEEKIEPESDVALTPPPPPEPPKAREEEAPPPAPPIPPMRQAALPAAPAEGAPNASTSNALPRWKSQVIGILERNKRYPSEARARRQQGVAQIAFSIDRQGNVTSTRIVTSSGSSALDREALQLARRAQPFPAPPAELPGTQVTLTVPIRFNLR